MKSVIKTTKFFLPLCLVLALGAILLLAPSAKADVGIDQPESGGLITPGQKTSDVKMKNESVVFTVKQGTGPFADAYTSSSPAESDRYYSHVKAAFTMQNLTNQPVALNLIFPFHMLVDSNQGGAVHQAKNAKVIINGAEVATTYSNDPVFSANNEWAAVGRFPATFAANADTTIVVEYDLRGVQQAKSPNVAFEYMMQTGSQWAGAIEHGEVTFEFEGIAIDSTAPFADINSFFKAENGKLIWKFDNLEPTASDDIKVSFDPYILKTVWPQRQSFINNLTASAKSAQGNICGNTRNASPDCNSVIVNGVLMGVGTGYQNTSPVNVLTAQSITQANGWLVPYQDGSDKWLEFSFDGDYTIGTVNIRSGILDTNPDYGKGIEQKSGSGAFYDSFRRPKTVLVTFADGTQETVTLADTPQEMQELALQNDQKPTNKIRLTFPDNYPGVNFGNAYFGVGRVAFGNVQKANTAVDIQTAGTLPQATNWPLYTGITAGVIVLIGVGVGAAIIISHHRHAKKALQSKAVPKATEPKPELKKHTK